MTREGAYAPRTLFEQRPQILKHFVFFLRLRAIGEEEFLAQVQRFSSHCRGIKPVLYGTQEFIPVHLALSRVPRVTDRSHLELIEWRFGFPIEMLDRIRNQPVLCEHDQVVGVHAVVQQVDDRLTLGLGKAVFRFFWFTEQFFEETHKGMFEVRWLKSRRDDGVMGPWIPDYFINLSSGTSVRRSQSDGYRKSTFSAFSVSSVVKNWSTQDFRTNCR